jgi:hypothetical protein
MNTTTYFHTAALVLLPLLVFVGQNSSCGRTNTNGTLKTVNGGGTNQPRELKGQWGGAGIELEVTSDGIDINFDCAHGHIDRSIVPDSAGNFSVKGAYVREHGGPMRTDENSDARTATYKGEITGDKMTLKVTFADGTDDVGPFTLERGRTARIHKCM